MIHPYELKAKDVHAYTARVLEEHLKIEANGYCCSTNMILDILIRASAECSSMEAGRSPAAGVELDWELK